MLPVCYSILPCADQLGIHNQVVGSQRLDGASVNVNGVNTPIISDPVYCEVTELELE